MSSLALALVLAGAPSLQPASDPVGVVGGTEVTTCGWPNVVAVGGRCTGTLIHPRVVVYAAHCGGAESVNFADNDLTGPKREVATRFCGVFPREEGELGRDFAFCVLAEPQLDVPIVPPLMGCEVDQLTPGTDVTVVGFGANEEGIAGIKRELVTTFDRFEDDEAFLTGNGDACIGDSGGPAFVRVADPAGGPDTWRVFGIVSHGDPDCIEGTFYGLMHVAMPWLEESADFDLTPCTDADGAWAPDARCSELPTAMDQLQGQWPDGCGGESRGGSVTTCGAPPDDGPDDEPPVITVANPAVDTEFETTSSKNNVAVEVELEAEDASGIAEVRLRIDGEDISGGAQGLAPFMYAPNFPAGTYVLDAVAVDYAGNEATSDPVTIAIDELLPKPTPPASGSEGCAAGGRPGSSWWLVLVFVGRARRRRER